jgi:PHD/YefM family antitoxin component YafN of YafNO toxin-antitoxin module
MITALIILLAVALGCLGGAIYMINKDRKNLNEFFDFIRKHRKITITSDEHGRTIITKDKDYIE